MFTGIVERIGRIVGFTNRGAAGSLSISCEDFFENVVAEESIAVNGVCLTVNAVSGQQASFDVVPESLGRTTLGSLRPGARVNLERAIRADGRFGGHFVQGHVDGRAVFEGRDPDNVFSFAADLGLIENMVPKGSVTIDGVSLTVASLEPARFSVALVPWTLEHTTLGSLKSRDHVNIETDLLGKWVRRILDTRPDDRGDGLDMDKLREHGFA